MKVIRTFGLFIVYGFFNLGKLDSKWIIVFGH